MEKTKSRAERSDGIKSRELILNAAARLATVEGLDGISIGRLADHIGMSKSGLYAHFGSKEELQLATIDKAQEIFQAEVVEPSMTEDPIAMMEALGRNFLSHLEREVFPGGCFFAYTSAELGPRPGPIHRRVADITGQWTVLFVQLLEAAPGGGRNQGRRGPRPARFRAGLLPDPGQLWLRDGEDAGAPREGGSRLLRAPQQGQDSTLILRAALLRSRLVLDLQLLAVPPEGRRAQLARTAERV